MASTKEQFDFILEQLSGLDEVSFRALYLYPKAGSKAAACAPYDAQAAAFRFERRKGSLGLHSDLKENF